MANSLAGAIALPIVDFSFVSNGRLSLLECWELPQSGNSSGRFFLLSQLLEVVPTGKKVFSRRLKVFSVENNFGSMMSELY